MTTEGEAPSAAASGSGGAPAVRAATAPPQPGKAPNQSYSSIDRAAQAVEAQDVLRLYDFKLKGQGFAAGAGASPLPHPGAPKILFAPPQAPAAAPEAAIAAAGLAAAPEGDRGVDGGSNRGAAAGADEGDAVDSKGRPPECDSSGLPMMIPLQQQQSAAAADDSSGRGRSASTYHQQQQASPACAAVGKEEESSGGGGADGTQQQPATAATAAQRSRSSGVNSGATVIGIVRALFYVMWRRLAALLLWAARAAAALAVAPLVLAFGPWYSHNRLAKERSRAALSHAPTRADLRRLLGAVPAWLAELGSPTERLDWLNRLLADVWPVLDPIASAAIRSSVEPLLHQNKPPFIAAMGFQRLTLGELPIVLEGLRVVPHAPPHATPAAAAASPSPPPAATGGGGGGGGGGSKTATQPVPSPAFPAAAPAGAALAGAVGAAGGAVAPAGAVGGEEGGAEGSAVPAVVATADGVGWRGPVQLATTGQLISPNHNSSGGGGIDSTAAAAFPPAAGATASTTATSGSGSGEGSAAAERGKGAAAAGAAEGQGTAAAGHAVVAGYEEAMLQLPERVEMEVDFRWVGEPNVAFFVELALMGPYTRLVPRVSNLSVRGTLRLALAPLVPTFPGFGALMVSLVRTPQVKFVLDFGPALGGRYTARPVAAFLDPFLRDTLANTLVWPQRFVVPLLPREVTGPLDVLNLRSVGVVQVEVLQARGLQRGGGWLSSIDPQVELFTQPGHRVRTAPKRATTHPKWKGEAVELLVQEPSSQLLRVAVYDIEMLNVKELLRVNLLKGAREVIRSSRLIGRASVPLAAAAAEPFQRREQWEALSQTDWANELEIGEGGGGEVQLALTYHPLLRQPPDAPVNSRGVLFVDIRGARGLPPGDWLSGATTAFAEATIASQSRRTGTAAAGRDPVWCATFEFFNVRLNDTMTIKVFDYDFLKPNGFLGRFDLPMKDLLTRVTGDTRGLTEGWFELQGRRHGAGKGGGGGEGGVAGGVAGGGGGGGGRGGGGEGVHKRRGRSHGSIELRVQYRGYE